MTRRGPSHSGPFGLACTNCFKSKSKCIVRPGAQGHSCARCYRLGKDCHPSDSIRRSGPSKKQNSTARIAELESKVEDLLSHLQVPSGVRNKPEVLGQPGMGIDKTEHTVFHEEGSIAPRPHAEENNTRRVSWSDQPRDARLQTEAERLPTPSALDLTTHLDEAEDERLLFQFRTQMLHHFPVLHLRSEMTAQQLRRTRPFLLSVIACVASSSRVEKISKGKLIKRIIFEETIGNVQASNFGRLDLLLGILVYVGWGWEHVLNRNSVSQLMLHAISLACEMRSTGPLSDVGKAMERFAPRFSHVYNEKRDLSAEDFLQRQRAILGCFLLSSVVSAHFEQIDALRWTVQEEEALASISLGTGCATDTMFAAQIRLQCFIEKASRVRREQENDKGQTLSEAATLPALLSITSLRQQLQDYQATLNRPLLHRNLVVAHVYSVQLHLNEAEYVISSSVPLMVTQFERMTNDGSFYDDSDAAKKPTTFHEQTMRLWQCVHSSSACVLEFLELPTMEFTGVSLIQWAQIVRSVVVLDHLTNHNQDPTWDRPAVREHIDLPRILDRCALKLEMASQQLGETGDDEVFAQLSRIMREFRNDMADKDQNERRSHSETNADWLRSVVHAGAGGATPMNAKQLASIAKDTAWLGSHIPW